MKQVLTPDRSVLIHDFDGVHYDYKDHPDIYVFLGGANARAVVRTFPHLTFDEAIKIAVESYNTHHNGFSGFQSHASEKGWDEDTWKFKHSKEYHQQAYADLLVYYPDYIAACAETLEHFESTKGQIRHCLLTQSDLEHWARPLLQSMGYIPYFEPEGLLGFEECAGHYKAKSDYPLRLALSVMQAAPEQSTFMEDSLPNLEVAKQVGNVLNVYVHHGRPLETLPSYVDMQVAKPRDLMRQIRDLKAQPGQDNRQETENGVLPSPDLACK